MTIDEAREADETVKRFQQLSRDLQLNSQMVYGIKNELMVCIHIPEACEIALPKRDEAAEELKMAICRFFEAKCDELAARMKDMTVSTGKCSEEELRQSLPVYIPYWKTEESKDNA